MLYESDVKTGFANMRVIRPERSLLLWRGAQKFLFIAGGNIDESPKRRQGEKFCWK